MMVYIKQMIGVVCLIIFQISSCQNITGGYFEIGNISNLDLNNSIQISEGQIITKTNYQVILVTFLDGNDINKTILINNMTSEIAGTYGYNGLVYIEDDKIKFTNSNYPQISQRLPLYAYQYQFVKVKNRIYFNWISRLYWYDVKNRTYVMCHWYQGELINMFYNNVTQYLYFSMSDSSMGGILRIFDLNYKILQQINQPGIWSIQDNGSIIVLGDSNLCFYVRNSNTKLYQNVLQIIQFQVYQGGSGVSCNQTSMICTTLKQYKNHNIISVMEIDLKIKNFQVLSQLPNKKRRSFLLDDFKTFINWSYQGKNVEIQFYTIENFKFQIINSTKITLDKEVRIGYDKIQLSQGGEVIVIFQNSSSTIKLWSTKDDKLICQESMTVKLSQYSAFSPKFQKDLTRFYFKDNQSNLIVVDGKTCQYQKIQNAMQIQQFWTVKDMSKIIVIKRFYYQQAQQYIKSVIEISTSNFSITKKVDILSNNQFLLSNQKLCGLLKQNVKNETKTYLVVYDKNYQVENKIFIFIQPLSQSIRLDAGLNHIEISQGTTFTTFDMNSLQKISTFLNVQGFCQQTFDSNLKIKGSSLLLFQDTIKSKKQYPFSYKWNLNYRFIFKNQTTFLTITNDSLVILQKTLDGIKEVNKLEYGKIPLIRKIIRYKLSKNKNHILISGENDDNFTSLLVFDFQTLKLVWKTSKLYSIYQGLDLFQMDYEDNLNIVIQHCIYTYDMKEVSWINLETTLNFTGPVAISNDQKVIQVIGIDQKNNYFQQTWQRYPPKLISRNKMLTNNLVNKIAISPNNNYSLILLGNILFKVQKNTQTQIVDEIKDFFFLNNSEILCHYNNKTISIITLTQSEQYNNIQTQFENKRLARISEGNLSGDTVSLSGDRTVMTITKGNLSTVYKMINGTYVVSDIFPLTQTVIQKTFIGYKRNILTYGLNDSILWGWKECPYRYYSDGKCVCPQNSSPDKQGSQCLCNDQLKQMINRTCTCKSNFTQFNSTCCPQYSINAINGTCICKNKMTLSQNRTCICKQLAVFYEDQCICIEGTFSQASACKKCHFLCQNCSDDSINCQQYSLWFWLLFSLIVIIFILIILIVIWKFKKSLKEKRQQKEDDSAQKNILSEQQRTNQVHQ